ncbi:putative site-specific DNA methylase [Shimwellia blattae DSM 4481 = NBRC 105725]|uniref:Cytosine-specific methyltransferase n=2 Tax=Shimwellia blattae TaxID=563 RepID=I2B9G9_SHIBC|nr:putative site-specific DNA methylase [Shimwellia blattae DSM 4481 = NBRC 105725]
MSSAPKPIALDLFCGSGAVSFGLNKAGFNVVGAVDFDALACKTYSANHPSVRLLQQDIRKVTPEQFSDLIPNGLDLLVVCAPCQPFSNQNRTKNAQDSRRNLVFESKKFINYFKPSVVFLENVPGLASTGIFLDYKNWLSKSGYVVMKPTKVNAATLGVPQRRMRMVLIATKKGLKDFSLNIETQSKITVSQAIGELPVPPIGVSSDLKDPLHFARRHSTLNIQRLEQIPKNGGGRESLPDYLQLNCHKKSKGSSFSDTYGRMRWDDVAPTLTTGCTDITKGRFAHPEQNRSITLREAARLQSFPDEYIFHGNSAQIATQIGNAVPPEMMHQIGLAIYEYLYPKKAASILEKTERSE